MTNITEIAVLFLNNQDHCLALMTTDTQVLIGAGQNEQQALRDLLDSSGMPPAMKWGYLSYHHQLIQD